jgi:hypothetical protein
MRWKQKNPSISAEVPGGVGRTTTFFVLFYLFYLLQVKSSRKLAYSLSHFFKKVKLNKVLVKPVVKPKRFVV